MFPKTTPIHTPKGSLIPATPREFRNVHKT
jgi:hypothetical protein